jgi:predicted nucleotidyltransferase
MGVAFGDAVGDGHVDLVITNFAEDFTTLYRGNGEGFFEDVSDMSGVGRATFMSLSWGTALVDLDNDSDLDLVIVNGHIYPQVDDHPQFEMTYRQRNQLLENRGAGVFVDVSAEAGPGFLIEESSRGLAAGDYDDDGDLDLLISNLDAPPTLLRNDSKTGHWLSVTLDVPAGGGTAIGARVSVTLGGRTLSRTATSGDSFMSVHDPRLHFGLGRATRADLVRVEWPDGSVTERRDIPADRFLEIRKEVVEPAIEDRMPPESQADHPGAPS